MESKSDLSWITLRFIQATLFAGLYQQHPDDTLLTAIADLLNISVAEAKKLLQGEQSA